MLVEFGFLWIQFPSYRVVNRHIRGVENTMPLQRRNSWPLGGSGRSVADYVTILNDFLHSKAD